MVETFVLNIDNDITIYEFNKLLSFVSREKKERIMRFYKFEDAQRTLLGDILARYAIYKRLGLRNHDLIFSINEYGKPILTEPKGIYFNISHSGNWVVCAIDEKQVGIDIEQITQIDLKIAERFFSSNEYLSIINQPNEIRQEFFYKLWTLKEAYIKAVGKGLSMPLDSFSIMITNDEINILENGKISGYSSFQICLNDNTFLAICSLSKEFKDPKFMNSTDFIKEVNYYYNMQI